MHYEAGVHYGRKKLSNLDGANRLLKAAIKAANRGRPFFETRGSTVAKLSRSGTTIKVLFGPATQHNLEIINDPRGMPTWWVMVSLNSNQ